MLNYLKALLERVGYVHVGGWVVFSAIALLIAKWNVNKAKVTSDTAARIAHDLEQVLRTGLATSWHKPLERTPVSIDLPRLASSISIVNSESKQVALQCTGPGRQHNLGSDSSSDSVNLGSDTVNNTLSISDKVARVIYTIEETLSETWNTSNQSRENRQHEKLTVYQTPKLLQSYLQKEFGEASSLTQILKACTQGILAPAVIQLKKSFQCPILLVDFPREAELLKFKDVSGSWRIKIAIGADRIQITHSKREISWNSNFGAVYGRNSVPSSSSSFSSSSSSSSPWPTDANPNPVVEFGWQLSLVFTRSRGKIENNCSSHHHHHDNDGHGESKNDANSNYHFGQIDDGLQLLSTSFAITDYKFSPSVAQSARENIFTIFAEYSKLEQVLIE